MKRIYLATAILLLSAVWMAAQQPSDPGQNNSAKHTDETTIQGCLNGSGTSFTLTDKSGKAYQLEGDASKLTDHVGHEVQLIGTPSAGSGSSSDEQPTFTVKKLKMLAASCSK